MPPKRSARSTSRRNTPQSPPKPPSSAPSPHQTRRSGRASYRDEDGAQRDSAELGLQPVPEVDEDDSIEVAGDLAEDEEVASDDSSNGETKLAGLDYDDLVDNLIDLHRESLNVLGPFTNQPPTALNDFFVELRSEGSKTQRRFLRQVEKLAVTSKAYGEQLFIDTAIVARKLQGDSAELVEGNWRPDAVLYLANLAKLMATVVFPVDDDLEALLHELHTKQHALFGAAEPTSRFRTLSIEQSLNFFNAARAQHFVHVANARKGEPDFDPDTILNDLFYEDAYIRGSNIPGRDDLAAATENVVKEIKKFVTTNSKNPVKVPQLEKAFPFVGLVRQAVEWVIARTRELENQIAAQTGVDAIVAYIRHRDFAPLLAGVAQAAAQAALEQQVPIDPQLTQDTASARRGRPKRLSGAALAKEIGQAKGEEASRHAAAKSPSKRAKKTKAQEIPESEVEADAAIQPEFNAEPNLPFDEEADIDGALRPSAQTLLVSRILAAQERESNKENSKRSLLDRQDNARRIPWNDTQDPDKRQRDDESEDDEFEQDSRPPKQARKGKGRARVEQGQSSTQPQPRRSPLQPIDIQAFQPPPSTAPPVFQTDEEIAALPQGSQYAAVNARAKENVQRAREANAGQRVQVRRAWTADENARLIELIGINGSKYAKILQDDKDAQIYPDGPLLQHRSQVQLKDKARNVKVDYLKGRYRLPDGFSGVSIGKKFVDKLRDEYGIDYIDGTGRGDELGGEVDE